MFAEVKAGIFITCLIIAAAIGAGAAWWLQGNRYEAEIGTLKTGHAEDMLKIAETHSTALGDQLAENARLTQQVALLDKLHSKELEDERKKNTKLQSDLASGAKRMSARARSCTDNRGGASAQTGAASVDDAPGRAELLQEDSANLSGIGADADEAARQLTGLQAYVRTVCK